MHLINAISRLNDNSSAIWASATPPFVCWELSSFDRFSRPVSLLLPPPRGPPGRNTNSSESWHHPELEVLPYRVWTTDTAYAPVPSYTSQELDPAYRIGAGKLWKSALPSRSPSVYDAQYPPMWVTPAAERWAPPLSQDTYTHTLVGPLTANASYFGWASKARDFFLIPRLVYSYRRLVSWR